MASTPAQRKTCLSELEQGTSLRKACEAADIPSPAHFLTEVNSDPALSEQYLRAREMGYTLLGDDLRQVSDDDSIPADHKRIMVDTRKWMLSKMLPKIYGDRLDLNHSGKISSEHTLTTSELMAIAAKGKGGES